MSIRKDDRNPESNKLPQGVQEDTFLEALAISGYPLQGIIGQQLIDQSFDVTEEWGFIDSDSEKHRALDIHASTTLGNEIDAEIKPYLTLLIECKRSRHPYVFFKSTKNIPLSEFPEVIPLKPTFSDGTDLSIQYEGTNSYRPVSYVEFLGLQDDGFLCSGPNCLCNFC